MFFTEPDFLYEEPLDIRSHPDVDGKSEMSSWQQSFLCGLIRKHRPKKILEVGVSAGGTTAVILRCLETLGMTDSTLWSVDLLANYYQDPNMLVGQVVTQAIPQMTDQWRLKTGHHVAHWLEEIGGDIDFVVLDAAHILPGELLDFICILPYLKEGAVVVLHDLQLYEYAADARKTIATHILMQTVTAQRILCQSPENSYGLPHIGAFCVTPETRKYQESLFYALRLPWEYIHLLHDRRDIISLLEKHYGAQGVEVFNNALLSTICGYFRLLEPQLQGIQSLAMWGSGGIGELFANYLVNSPNTNIPSIAVVDKNPARQGQELEGITIQSPEAVLAGSNRPQMVIICVYSPSSQQEILTELSSWGYVLGETAFICSEHI